MDISLKKIELIEWLVRLQDEKSIRQIEELKKDLSGYSYESRMPKSTEELEQKLIQSEQDQIKGRVRTQQDVEKIFSAKFGK